MISAINLYYQTFMPRGKISYVIANNMLAQEFDSQDTIPKVLP